MSGTAMDTAKLLAVFELAASRARTIDEEADADDARRAVKELIQQVTDMKSRACIAHELCNKLRLAYPEVAELGDDGLLHEAIHDILRVETPLAKVGGAT